MQYVSRIYTIYLKFFINNNNNNNNISYTRYNEKISTYVRTTPLPILRLKKIRIKKVVVVDFEKRKN